METDDQIKAFIENTYPATNDSGKFLSELQEKLVIMDQAKSLYKKEIHESNRWIMAAFIVGAVFGCAAILTVIFGAKPQLPSMSNIYKEILNLVIRGRFFIFATLLSFLGLTIFILKNASKTVNEK